MISGVTRGHLSALLSDNYIHHLSTLFAAASISYVEEIARASQPDRLFEFVSSLNENECRKLLVESCKQKRLIRAAAPIKRVFDDRWELFESALRLDGYEIQHDRTIIATEVLPVAELISNQKFNDLLAQLPEQVLQSVERLLGDAEKALADPTIETMNGAMACFRTLLETVYRNTVTELNILQEGVVETDLRWGESLRFLRESSVITTEEESAVSAQYTLMSGFHKELLPDRRDEIAFHRAITLFWILFIIERFSNFRRKAQ